MDCDLGNFSYETTPDSILGKKLNTDSLPKDIHFSKVFSNPLQNALCLGKKEIEEMPIKQLNYILSLGFYTAAEVEYIRRMRRNLKCKAYVKKSRNIQRELETQMESEVDVLEIEKCKLREEKKKLEKEIEFYKFQFNHGPTFC